MMSKIIPNNSKPKPATSEPISSFIRKTFDILQDNKYPKVVGWNSEGDSLIIYKPEEFALKVLPAYFKHNQITSFVRQLNLYSFRKCKLPKQDHVYQHELFQRDKKHLLKGIKRRTQGLNLESVQKSIETMKASTSSVKDKSAISYENRLLRNFHNDTMARITSLETHVKDLTIQNQALWNEVSHQEEREDVLKDFISKILVAYDTPVEELNSLLPTEDVSTVIHTIGEKKDSKSNGPFKEKDCSTCISVGCLLKMEEDSTESTEVGSHASPQRSEADKKSKKSVDLTQSLPIIGDLLAKISNKMKEQEEGHMENKSSNCKDLWENGYGWSLETQYLRKLEGLHRTFDDQFLDKNQLDNQNVLGKRTFSEVASQFETARSSQNSDFSTSNGNEEGEGARKILHQNPAEFSLLFNSNSVTEGNQ